MARTDDFFNPFMVIEDFPERPPIDEWKPESDDDRVFYTTKGAILMDVSSFYHLEERNPDLDAFYLDSKRAYNGEMVREHIADYLNYFEKFYDFDHELPSIYASIKYMIDYEPSYGKDALFYDISRYFINRLSPIFIKLNKMNEDCYCLQLTYRNKKNPVLQYRNRHAKLLMLISVLMGMIIIPVCHFMKVRKIKKPNEFLMEIFDRLLQIDPDIDIYSKLMETASSSVHQSEQKNQDIFNKQDIRGLNSTIHSQNSVINILINIIPKYKYSENIINLNFRSILNNTGLNMSPIWKQFQMKTLLIAGSSRILLHYNRVISPMSEKELVTDVNVLKSKSGRSSNLSRLNQQLSTRAAGGERQLEFCKLFVLFDLFYICK